MLETFHGFIKDTLDAQLLVESCIAHSHNPVLDLPVGMASFPLRSGTVIVFPEGSQETLRVRWRDGCNWSSSKVNGPFLLYRETEIKSPASNPTLVKQQQQQQQQQTKREKPAGLFTVTSLRANTQLVPNGFAKRTISILGSNNRKYRVVSYFTVKDVEHFFTRNPPPPSSFTSHSSTPLQTPSQLREFDRFIPMIRMPFRHTTPSAESLGSVTTTPIPPLSAAASLTTPIFSTTPATIVAPLIASIEMDDNDAPLFYKLNSDYYSLGASALQSNLKFFQENPHWSESPVYLPPLRFSHQS
ncbi:hypothetical protein HDU80_010980, partial [Chytriomyces hyalinus]